MAAIGRGLILVDGTCEYEHAEGRNSWKGQSFRRSWVFPKYMSAPDVLSSHSYSRGPL